MYCSNINKMSCFYVYVFLFCFLLYTHFILRIVKLKIAKVLIEHYFVFSNLETSAKF